MTTDPTPIVRGDSGDPIRALADDTYAKALAAHERGNSKRAAVLLVQAADIGAAVELTPDEKTVRCVLTGGQADGYARTLDGMRVSHGSLEERPTALQRWLAADDRPVTGPITGKGKVLSAALPDAFLAALRAQVGHTLAITITDVDLDTHEVTAVFRNRGGHDERASRTVHLKDAASQPAAEGPPPAAPGA